MKKIVCLAAVAVSACGEPEAGRDTAFDAPCIEFFKSKTNTSGDILARDSWAKKGMIVVELARAPAAVNAAVKGAIPDSPAAAKYANVENPAVAHCIVNPEDGSMKLPTAFDHSWEKDEG
jgi:hypothetical protein